MRKTGLLVLALLIFCEVCHAASGSGQCGDNVLYSYNYDSSSGYLQIQGNGPMWNFQKNGDKPDSNHPWYGRNNNGQPRLSLTEVTVGEGVTTIGKNAFYEFDICKTIKLPSKLDSIGEQSFFKCKKVTSLKIPTGVETLPHMSLYMLESLTSLELPTTLKRIEKLALSWCTKLTSIVLPEGLTYIGPEAFDACKLVEDFELPESLVEIGDKAFNRMDKMTNITIHKNVEKIGNAVFARNALLHTIDVDPDNQYFSSDNDILYNKDKTELVAYPPNKQGSTYTVPSYVNSIRNGAFSYANGLQKVTIPSSVSMVEDNAFAYCTPLKRVEYLGLFDCDCGTNVFASSSKVTTVYVPLQYQGDTYCNKPVSKELIVGVSWYLNEVTGLMIIYGNGTMDDYASPKDAPWFNKKSLIKKIEIWDGVESVGDNAFTECGNLTALFISPTVTRIGAHAFEKCDNLMFVSYDGKQNPCGEGEGAFAECDVLDLFCVPLDYESDKFCDSTYVVKADSCTSPAPPATTPYNVASLDDFMMLELYAMNGMLTFDVSIDMDMDFNTLRLSQPLGINYAHECTAYEGIVEGNNHMVSNLAMSNTKDYHYDGSALFCKLQDATIKDLTFTDNCEFTGIKAAALSLEAAGNVVVKNVINNAKVSGVTEAAGFVGALVDDTSMLTVNNSANKGSVTATSGRACGVFCMDSDATVGAYNVLCLGDVNGESDSSSFTLWDKSTASTFTEMSVFGLEPVCRNCDSSVKLFYKNETSQLFFTKAGDERVDGLMNKFSNDNEMTLLWSRELDFTSILNVRVTGETVLDDKYKYGTILDEITELRAFLNNTGYAIEDKYTGAVYIWSTVVEMDMDIVVNEIPVSSSSSSEPSSSSYSSAASSYSSTASSYNSYSSYTSSASYNSDSSSFSHEIKVNCTPLKPSEFNEDDVIDDICRAAGVDKDDVFFWDKEYDKDGNIIGFKLLTRDEETKRKIEEILKMCYALNEEIEIVDVVSGGSRIDHLAAFFVMVIAALISVITF